MRKEGGKVNYMHMIPTECMFSRALIHIHLHVYVSKQAKLRRLREMGINSWLEPEENKGCDAVMDGCMR